MKLKLKKTIKIAQKYLNFQIFFKNKQKYNYRYFQFSCTFLCFFPARHWIHLLPEKNSKTGIEKTIPPKFKRNAAEILGG